MLHFLISLFVIVKGPEDWHDLELKKDNQCGGNRQSPINIKTSEVEEEDSYRRLKITRDFKIGHYGRLGRLDRCDVTQKTRDLLPSSFWDGMFSPGFSS